LEEEPLLDASITNSGYSGMQVIWDCSVKVFPREFVLLLGANGAGKTTFLKSIMGIIKPVAGRIILRGEDISDVPLQKKNTFNIIFLSEETYFPNLTIYENLRMGVMKLDKTEFHRRLKDVFSMFPDLSEKEKNRSSSLSGGQRKMLIMARALMGNPDLLIVDEPSSGLSPLFVDRILDVMEILKKRGISMLVSEQNVEFVSLADRVYVLDNGRIIFNGTPEEALKDNAIHKAYFNI